MPRAVCQGNSAGNSEVTARTVLVTGGARRIGADIVRTLARRGHRVIIHHHRSAAEAAALCNAIRREGGRAFNVSGDLANDPVAILRDAANAAGTPVDGLVNNASVFDFDRPPAFRAELLIALNAVNLSAPIALACALSEQPDLSDGAVVNILDQKVANLNPDFFSYTCTKAALQAATTMLAQALAPRVRVNAVSPGLALPSHDQSEAEFHSVSTANLLGTPVPLTAIGEACDYLLRASAVTGQNLFVDNGQRFITRTEDVMFDTRAPRRG